MSKAGTNFWCWWRVHLQLPDVNQREANAVFQQRDDELQSVVETTADAIAAASLQDHPTRKTTTKLIFFLLSIWVKEGLVEWGGGKERQQGLPHHHLPIRHLSTEKPNSPSSHFKFSGDRWTIQQDQKLDTLF
jgi:hypothetical protein